LAANVTALPTLLLRVKPSSVPEKHAATPSGR
jgi:hypothetical protein